MHCFIKFVTLSNDFELAIIFYYLSRAKMKLKGDYIEELN